MATQSPRPRPTLHRGVVRQHPGDARRDAAAGERRLLTTADHIAALSAAIAQVPAAHRKRLPVRADGAGSSHGLLTGHPPGRQTADPGASASVSSLVVRRSGCALVDSVPQCATGLATAGRARSVSPTTSKTRRAWANRDEASPLPMIHVYMLEGRTRDQKRRIIEGMTNAMVDVCGSKVERVGVIIHELSADNWGRDGAPMRDEIQATNGAVGSDPRLTG